MTIVDTHCHAGIHKYEPVEFLLFHMEKAGVDQAVLIQYMGNSDNAYLAECLRQHPKQLAAAMIVDADDDGTAMRRWHEQGLGGIRLPADSRAGDGSLAQWKTAAEIGLVVSVPCRPATLLGDPFREVVETFGELSIVIEHLGGAGRDEQAPYTEFQGMLKLASHTNITMKLPGFGEFCHLPHPFEDVPPLARMAVDAFGPKRIMWGSDYPPVSSREGYDNSLSFPSEYFSDLSDEDRAWIFGRTATKVWGLGET